MIKAIYVPEKVQGSHSVPYKQTEQPSNLIESHQPVPSVSFIKDSITSTEALELTPFTDINDCLFTRGSSPIVSSEENVVEDRMKINEVTKETIPESVRTKHPFENQSEAKFSGLCVDSGAAVSTVGIPQILLYCERYKVALSLEKERAAFAFGESVHNTCRIITAKLPLPNNSFVQIPVSVVNIDVPIFVGLDILRKHKMILDYDANVLKITNPKWQMTFTFIDYHSYIVPSSRSIFLTRKELEKLHTQFGHPTPERLFQTLRRADPTTSSPIKEILDEITAACDLCVEFHSPHFDSEHRFLQMTFYLIKSWRVI